MTPSARVSKLLLIGMRVSLVVPATARRRPAQRGGVGSVLDCTGGHAGGDVLLGEDEQQGGRDRCHDGGGHHRAPLLVLGADVVVDAHGCLLYTSPSPRD